MILSCDAGFQSCQYIAGIVYLNRTLIWTGGAQLEPEDLIELLRYHTVYIQTHNFPDPDALASAFGLQNFLKYYGIRSTLCYYGRIDKLSTKRMLTAFGIEIYAKEELTDMRQDDYIINIDSQKYNANVMDLVGKEVACIDHHPTFIEVDYLYKDVRIVGACASLIADYYVRCNVPIEQDTATALCYGIKIDTAGFTRGVTDLDVNMFAYLFQHADREKFSAMFTNTMELNDLKAYGAAIESVQIFEQTGFAYIPFECPDALVAMISDFILSLNVVNVTVVYAVRDNGLKFSVRSDIKEVNAGKVTFEALKEIGGGGGHQAMAGGFIDKDKVAGLEPDMHNQIRKRFLDAIGR